MVTLNLVRVKSVKKAGSFINIYPLINVDIEVCVFIDKHEMRLQMQSKFLRALG